MNLPLVLMGSLLVMNLAGTASAGAGRWPQPAFRRDRAVEETLRYSSRADFMLTPGRVLRWMLGARGVDCIPPGRTEFKPVLDADERGVRIVATLAYKF